MTTKVNNPIEALKTIAELLNQLDLNSISSSTIAISVTSDDKPEDKTDPIFKRLQEEGDQLEGFFTKNLTDAMSMNGTSVASKNNKVLIASTQLTMVNVLQDLLTLHYPRGYIKSPALDDFSKCLNDKVDRIVIMDLYSLLLGFKSWAYVSYYLRQNNPEGVGKLPLIHELPAKVLSSLNKRRADIAAKRISTLDLIKEVYKETSYVVLPQVLRKLRNSYNAKARK